MFHNLTFNSVFMLFLGLILMAFGGFAVVRWRMYPFGAGLISLGSGVVLWGWTNGFTDYSHRGLLFWKFGVLSLIIGAGLLGFHFFRSF